MKYIKLFNLLNVDVALGACGMSYFIGKYLNVEIPLLIYVLLFSAVIAIYLADHLIDQYKIKSIHISQRRLFYKQNACYLFVLLFIIVVLGIALAVFFLDMKILCTALFPVLGVVFYLVFNYFLNRDFIPKEVIIALLYLVGISFYPFVISEVDFRISFILLFSILFLIALENLLIYSIIDHDDDKNCGLSSFSTRFGLPFCKSVLFYTFILTFVFLIAVFISIPEKGIYLLVLTVIHAAQIFVFINRNHLINHSLYRWIADGVFILPFLLFVIS